MTYENLIAINNVLSCIPLTKEDKALSPKAATEIIFLQVAYQKKVADFDSFMFSVLQKLKKDGFDERSQKYAFMKNVFSRLAAPDDDGDVRPTDEDVEEAKKIQETADDFEKELAELEAVYQTAYNEKLKEDVGTLGKMPKSTYEELVDFIGLVGETEIEVGKAESKKIKVLNQVLLKYICFHLVFDNE